MNKDTFQEFRKLMVEKRLDEYCWFRFQEGQPDLLVH